MCWLRQHIRESTEKFISWPRYFLGMCPNEVFFLNIVPCGSHISSIGFAVLGSHWSKSHQRQIWYYHINFSAHPCMDTWKEVIAKVLSHVLAVKTTWKKVTWPVCHYFSTGDSGSPIVLFLAMIKRDKNWLDWLIDFNGMSTSLGLFHA